MYKLLGICLALAAFLAVNTILSLAALVGWRVARSWLDRFSARVRAELLFALRMLPPILALIFVAFFLAPAYVIYEPHSTSEVVSVKLAAFAILAAFGVLFAAWRCGRSLMATHTLRKQWMRTATEIRLPNIDVRTFHVVHRFPIIAVIGTVRPQLFIADQVLQSLSAGELAAAIAHEHGHLSARDNLKRGLLRVCRDALIVPFGSALDRSWAETAEAAADEVAAQTSPHVALNLASALVRIARMVPVGGRAKMPLAAFLVGDERRGIKDRVRRLIEMAASNHRSPATDSYLRVAPLLILIAVLVGGIAVASNSPVLLAVHAVVERVVGLLS